MFDEAEGYVLGDPVQSPPQAGQTGYPGRTTPLGRLDHPSGGNPASALFLPRLLRMNWEIGERLWLSICSILTV
jgi:hypothetical protein